MPPKTFFLDNLFENITYFSEEKLLQVTKKLEIGEPSKSEEHSHEEHQHRRRRSVDNENSGITFTNRRSRRAADEHDHSSNNSYEGKVSAKGYTLV